MHVPGPSREMCHESESRAEVFWPSLRGVSPGVAVMEAAQAAMCDDPSSRTGPSLRRSHLWSVLVQGEMTAIARVIVAVVPKQAPEMALVQDHHAIQPLPPATPDPALGDAILPGTPRCDPLLGSTPIARIADMTLSEKIESRSNTK